MPTRAILHKTRQLGKPHYHPSSRAMQTEAQCPASARYLDADELYSDATLKLLQAECVQQFQNRPTDAAYHTFVQWTRQANEVAVFTWNAYADLAIPKQFDCVFHVDNPNEHLLIRYELVQSAINLGGFWPINRVEHGHKHLCVFRFEQEVPAVFQLLPNLQGSVPKAPPPGASMLGFCQAADLPAIIAEHGRTAQLRAQYGAQWWKFDEQLNESPG